MSDLEREKVRKIFFLFLGHSLSDTKTKGFIVKKLTILASTLLLLNACTEHNHIHVKITKDALLILNKVGVSLTNEGFETDNNLYHWDSDTVTVDCKVSGLHASSVTCVAINKTSPGQKLFIREDSRIILDGRIIEEGGGWQYKGLEFRL